MDVGLEPVRKTSANPNISFQLDNLLLKAFTEEKMQRTIESVIVPNPDESPDEKLKLQTNALSRAPAFEADSTHHSEIRFQNQDEEKLWKSTLKRLALQRNRTEKRLQLHHRNEPSALPAPSSRALQKINEKKVRIKDTGRLQPTAIGTYGYLYLAHVDTKTSPVGRGNEMQGIEILNIQLDVQQLVSEAILDVQPPLSDQQTEQLIQISADILGPLTEHEQQQLVYALKKVTPPLTEMQQDQMLTGTEIIPPITLIQQQQLLKANSKIFSSVAASQERSLIPAIAKIMPPVDQKQQVQIADAISKIFTTNAGDTAVLVTEKNIQNLSPKTIHQFNTNADNSSVQREYALDAILKSVIHYVEELLPRQRQEMATAYKEIFSTFTEPMQKRWVNAVTMITPTLTGPQKQQILTGSDITPSLTSKQVQQLLRASTELFVTLTVDQLRQIFDTTATVQPLLTSKQRDQLVDVFAEIFSSSSSSHSTLLVKELEALAHHDTTKRSMVEIVVKSVLSQIDTLLPRQRQEMATAYKEIFSTFTEPMQKRWVNAVTMITPTLTGPQKQQILTGSDITPSLTSKQVQQLLRASTELFVTLTVDQLRQIFDTTATVQPLLTSKQRDQLVDVFAEIFSSSSSSHSTLLVKELEALAHHDSTKRSMVEIVVKSVLSQIDTLLPRQRQEMATAYKEIFSTFTEPMQKRWVNAVTMITPTLTGPQKQQILTGSDITPSLTSKQVQQLLRASTELFVTLTVDQLRQIFDTTATVQPLLTSKQRDQLVDVFAEIFSSSSSSHSTLLVKELEALAHHDSTKRSMVEIVVKSVLSQIDTLLPRQRQEMATAYKEIFSTFTEPMQKRWVNAVTMITPTLTGPQKQQILTGSDITPSLTSKQVQQLLRASTELFVTLTVDQLRQIFDTTATVQPLLTSKQRDQLVDVFAEIFSSSSSSHSTLLVKELEALAHHDSTKRSMVEIVVKSVLSQIDTLLPRQRQEMATAYKEIFSTFTEPMQKRWVNAVTMITPTLTGPQKQQILTGSDITPSLTSKQVQQLLRASTELFVTLTVDQLRQIFDTTATVQPLLTSKQRDQLVDVFAEIFSSSSSSHSTLLVKELEALAHHDTTKRSMVEIVVKSVLSQIDTLLPRQRQEMATAYKEIFSTFTEPMQKRWVNAVTMITPTLTGPQKQQILTGSDITPSLTSKQVQQLLRASTELFVTLTVDQLRQIFDTTATVQPLLTSKQRDQLVDVFAEIFSSSSSSHSTLLVKELEALAHHDSTKRSMVEIVVKSVLSQIDTLLPRQRQEMATAYKEIFSTFTEPMQKRWVNAVTMITPTLTGPQKQQILTGSDITPSLTSKQVQQLLRASTELFVTLTVDQLRQILDSTVMLRPSLTSKQLSDVVDVFGMILSASMSSGDGSLLELLESFLRQQKIELVATSAGFSQWLILEIMLRSVMSEIRPHLSFTQQQQLFSACLLIFPSLTLAQTKCWLNVLSVLTPCLDLQQEYDLLSGNLSVFLSLTSTQQQQILKACAEAFGTLTVTQLKEVMSASTLVKPPFSSEQQRQLLNVLVLLFLPKTIKSEAFIEIFEDAFRHEHSPAQFVEHGSYSKDKQVPLEQSRKTYLAEQTTHVEDDEQDMEVSAISMNISKPRIKSEIMYMAPSPPNRCFSPSTGGFTYAASPPMGGPPLTEYSGFMYEAPVDGHNSPMFAELGTYGFTYHATLDGTEPYKRWAERNKGELQMHAVSRQRSPIESIPETTKSPVMATPPRHSPWSTPPVTPTPIMVSPPSMSREITPLLSVKELPEPSTESPWKKHDPLTGNGMTPWGQSWVNTDIKGEPQFPTHAYTFLTDVSSQQKGEIHQRIVETTTLSREHQEILEQRRQKAPSRFNRVTQLTSGPALSSESGEKVKKQAVDETMIRKGQQTSSSSEQQIHERKINQAANVHKQTVPRMSNLRPMEADADADKPEWVLLAEERDKRLKPQHHSFRLDKMVKEEPVSQRLEPLPEKNPVADRTSISAIKQALAEGNAGTAMEYRRPTIDTKEATHGSKVHSKQAMSQDVVEAGNLNLTSKMSQSLPSLASMWNQKKASVHRRNGVDELGAVSLEEIEIQKTSRHLQRNDGAEEETNDVSFARRGDTVSPEIKRTKRTVVRKLINGEWKDLAMKEEDMPVDGDFLLAIDQPVDHILAEIKERQDDEWSLSDAVIEETTTTRTIRRVEEEEEDIISMTGTE